MNPNVKMIRDEKIRVIRGSIPREVRTALSQAVKAGELGHLKKDKLKPEIFFYPDEECKSLALKKQTEIAMASIQAISKVCGSGEITTKNIFELE